MFAGNPSQFVTSRRHPRQPKRIGDLLNSSLEDDEVVLNFKDNLGKSPIEDDRQMFENKYDNAAASPNLTNFTTNLKDMCLDTPSRKSGGTSDEEPKKQMLFLDYDRGVNISLNLSFEDSDDERYADTQVIQTRPLEGVIVFVDVRAENENRSKAISRELERLGATISDKITGSITHLVFKDGRQGTITQLKKYSHVHFVSVLWVDACKTTNSKVCESLFPAKMRDAVNSPLPIARLKRIKSLQPKTFEEDMNNSAKKEERKKRRLRKLNREPETPHDQIICLDSQEYIKSSDLYKLVATPRAVPDTPWIFNYIKDASDDDQTPSQLDKETAEQSPENERSCLIDVGSSPTEISNPTLKATSKLVIKKTKPKVSFVKNNTSICRRRSTRLSNVCPSKSKECIKNPISLIECASKVCEDITVGNKFSKENLQKSQVDVSLTVVNTVLQIPKKKKKLMSKAKFDFPQEKLISPMLKLDVESKKRVNKEKMKPHTVSSKPNERAPFNAFMAVNAVENSKKIQKDKSVIIAPTTSNISEENNNAVKSMMKNTLLQLSCSKMNDNKQSNQSKKLISIHNLGEDDERVSTSDNNKNYATVDTEMLPLTSLKYNTSEVCKGSSNILPVPVIHNMNIVTTSTESKQLGHISNEIVNGFSYNEENLDVVADNITEVNKSVSTGDSNQIYTKWIDDQLVNNSMASLLPKESLGMSLMNVDISIADTFKNVNLSDDVLTENSVLKPLDNVIENNFYVNNDNFDINENTTDYIVENVQEGITDLQNDNKNKKLTLQSKQRRSSRLKEATRRSSGIDFKVCKSFHNTTPAKYTKVSNRGRKVKTKTVSGKNVVNCKKNNINKSSSTTQDELSDTESDLNGSLIHDENEGLICASQEEILQLEEDGQEEMLQINYKGDEDSGISDSEEIIDDGNISQETVDYSVVEESEPVANVPNLQGTSKTSEKKTVVKNVNEQTLNQTVVEPIRVKKKPASIVITSLHFSEQDFVKSVIKQLGNFTLRVNVTQDTTHIVAGGSRRTLNILHGIVHGCWILSPKWVADSLEQGVWLDEEGYEMYNEFPTAKINRLNRIKDGKSNLSKLFSKLPPMYLAQVTCPSHEDMVKLITSCGGKLTTSIRKAGVGLGLISCRRKDVNILTEKWIIDSITNGRIMPTKQYEVRLNTRQRSPDY